jgi:serine/threonine protein kinase
MHRDIKPDNLLINESCHIKFCDFGFSRVVPKDFDANSNLTKNINNLISKENEISKGNSLSDASSIFKSET